MQSKVKNDQIVTVIVSAYNEEKHIEECLMSIKNQTYPNIELIVIDDGSKDATAKIAKKYADVFIPQKHQGPGAARNKAAKIAKGQILVFIDADMYLDKDYVRNIIKPITKGEGMASFTKEEYVANPENIWSRCLIIDNNLPFNSLVKEGFPNESYVFRAIKKNTFINYGGFDVEKGYLDDQFFLNKRSKAINSLAAKSYHYNPETLADVFFSARWIGRSKKRSDIYKYIFLNSLRIALIKVINGVEFYYIIYKVIFDLGVFSGILTKNSSINSSK